MIGHLLFQPSDHDDLKDKQVTFTETSLGRYQPIAQQHQQDDDDEEDEQDENDQDDEDDNDDKENNPHHPIDIVYRIDSTAEDDDYDILMQGASSPPRFSSASQGEVVANRNINDDENNNAPAPQDDNGANNGHHNVTLIAPPTATAIAHAALDSLLLILISLFLFTISSAEGGRYVDGISSVNTFKFIALVAAPIFPLVTFVAGVVATIVPWNGPQGRKSQWAILLRTPWAPFFHVTFRDGFIGDILTSSVRPLQDVAFTFFYIASGLQGWWSQSHDWDDAASSDAMNKLPLESNWVLHTFILPMCMASPLFWRFLQNLRQTYEYKTRWPYLGNALKYFIAAEVAVYGVYMQSQQQSFWWLSAFVGATLYQIWWDVFMDWNLFQVEWDFVPIQDVPRRIRKRLERLTRTLSQEDEEEQQVSYFEQIKRKNKYHYHGGSALDLPIPVRISLRATRIYSVKWMYWSIFFINIVLRFCWTLSFLPPHYLNRAGVLSERFEGNLADALNPTIAVAEIIRRTLWGWLRVEWEAIKVGRQEPRLKGAWRDGETSSNNPSSIEVDKSSRNSMTPMIDDLEMKIIAMEGTLSNDDDDYVNDEWRRAQMSSSPWATVFLPNKRMYEMTEIQILGELCIYATIFTGLGLLAAAHRDTL
eukprot:CAMPEP_0113446190 /NCGR_PEP_ID=MMETSP0014_2-20120614/3576_1 /TAXON_ID=2857 /ORGANISM="Nitzschia sp." /LENGTH=648 /DNA_ID=CAMNT_0000337269 /DNA_START=146 /DNA_END=2092 /DNA_ORIENTATION=+ /assembly_acc=CAM_ASM_000159